MNVLVIDVGGSHVKLARSGIEQSRRFDSGPELSPTMLIDRIRQTTPDWEFDAVSLGLPGPVGSGGATAEPGNLGRGWVNYDFEQAFQKSVRVVNDAAMQALGAYDGGRMLFLGFGTGLGSTLVAGRVVVPLELGEIQEPGLEKLGNRLGKKGLERDGQASWKAAAVEAVCMLKRAFLADYVVLGGGHSALIDPLPAGVRCGGNDDAFTGGFRLWEQNIQVEGAAMSSAFRVVQ